MTAAVSVAVSSHPVECLTPMSLQPCLFGWTMASQKHAGGPQRGLSPHWAASAVAQPPAWSKGVLASCACPICWGLGHPFSLGTAEQTSDFIVPSWLQNAGCKTYVSAAVSGCKSPSWGAEPFGEGSPQHPAGYEEGAAAGMGCMHSHSAMVMAPFLP